MWWQVATNNTNNGGATAATSNNEPGIERMILEWILKKTPWEARTVGREKSTTTKGVKENQKGGCEIRKHHSIFLDSFPFIKGIGVIQTIMAC